MLLRYLLLLYWISAYGFAICVDKVSDCHRARSHCLDSKVGRTVRNNCSLMCKTCSNKNSASARRSPKNSKRKKKCVDNKQCRQWNRQANFCKSNLHTEATKQWLCPRLCFKCKTPKRASRKPNRGHKNPRPKPHPRTITTKKPAQVKPIQKPNQTQPQQPPKKDPVKQDPPKPAPVKPEPVKPKPTTQNQPQKPPKKDPVKQDPPKLEPKVTTIEPRVSTIEPKVEATTVLRAEHTTEFKVEATTESKVEVTTVPKAEPTTEPKVEATTETKVEATTVPKVETTTEPKIEATTLPKAEPTTEPKVEATTEPAPEPRPMTAASQQFKESIDETAPICDDFYQFTCGKYIKDHPIKSPEDNMNLFKTTKSEVRKRQVELILDNSPTTSQAVKTMRNYRDICINGPSAKTETSNLWKEIEDIGSARIFKDNWPILYGTQIITQSLVKMAKYSSSHYLFDLSVKKISPNEVKLLFLPVPLIYKNPAKYFDPKYFKEIIAIKTYIKEVLTLLLNDVGVNRPTLDKDIEKVIEYDRNRAKVYLSTKININDREALAETAEKKKWSTIKDVFLIDWNLYIENNYMLKPLKQYFSTDPDVYIHTENIFRAINRDIGSTSPVDFYNYFLVRFVLNQVPYLDSRFDDPYHKFIQAVGEEDKSAQHKQVDECVDECIAQFPLVNDFLYNKRYLKEDELQALQSIDTRKAVVELINDNKYLDAESKTKAVAKVNAMKEILGGVQQARNEKLLDQEYAGVVIDPKDTYRQMVIKVTAENKKNRLKLITTPGAATAFVDMRSTDIDLHQIHFENQYYIPAAIIQLPYFNKDNDHPAVLNFGYLAWLQARQVLHSVDPSGVQFDADGKRGYWMTRQSQADYGNRLVALQTIYREQIEEQSKRPLNSENTKNSDVVDHAAIRAAFRAYQNFRKANPTVNVTVPGFDQYSPEQQLFISFGTMMCASQGDVYLDRSVLDKTRSPPKNVVNTVVSHYDEFANAFKCPENSKMNPKIKVGVWN